MKRYIKSCKTILLAVALVMASSCDDFLDVNTSPNNLPSSEVQYILPGAELGIGFAMGNTIQLVNSLWVQHMAGTGTQSDPYDRYNIGPNDLDNEWDLMYASLLDDLQQVKVQGREEGNFIHAGMAGVLQAYTWAVTTDIWGDVPFSQALSFDQSATPVYDPQQNIYAGILTILNEAIADLGKTNAIASSEGDLIYSGDVAKWTKAANSIKLKLYIQSRKKNAAEATAGINDLIAQGQLITSNADNLNVPFFASSGAQNPLYMYNHLTRPNDMIASSRFIDSMQVLNDPRLPAILTQSGGAYIGYDNGAHTVLNFTSANRSRWGLYIVGKGQTAANGTINVSVAGDQAPFRLITSYMVYYWLAEAALTLGTSGDPATLYRQALQANFDDISSFLGAAYTPANFTADAQTYIAAREAAFNASSSAEGKLNVLIRDKWVSSAGNAYEAYNDYRRTGYPRLELPQNALAGVNRIPTRWPYVQGEIQSNKDNVPIPDENAYPAAFLIPIWWMQ
ncbi:SusD/RagB family nutrient-binding outer membrane lipoprotein [Rufibacter latericius]|uniref:SusD/RagB family nutrient-binding outer membrane lipoprotein n=1 Tax=Rufibacter latericius TaxID=2487040 RepID=A0A3M9N009_9BACT|nr:SusD/RagB family nutrient-binding outer membrane lipoprotein [Rufibacter latericius]RNI31090.1 SusD/RagB family nutrient-binding outer membrane lipoprotein [Rufibacter latericius]